MQKSSRIAITVFFTFALLDTSTTLAARIENILAELAALEREVNSISELGSTGAERYSRKISDIRSRTFKSDGVTSDQRRQISLRLSKLNSLIRSRTTGAGGPPVRSSSRARTGSTPTRSSVKSRSFSLPRTGRLPNLSSAASQADASDSSTARLHDLYTAAGNRYDRLPKALQAKGGPLDTEELKTLELSLPRFIREYATAVTQWRKDLTAIRQAASQLPANDYTRKRALELVEKRFPDRLRELVAKSRKTLVSHSTGLLNYVRGEYASRERQKDNGQYIIWIGSWDMDDCVQTAWDVAHLGLVFERSFGGSTDLFEKAKAEARVAARERTLGLQDRLSKKW